MGRLNIEAQREAHSDSLVIKREPAAAQKCNFGFHPCLHTQIVPNNAVATVIKLLLSKFRQRSQLPPLLCVFCRGESIADPVKRSTFDAKPVTRCGPAPFSPTAYVSTQEFVSAAFCKQLLGGNTTTCPVVKDVVPGVFMYSLIRGEPTNLCLQLVIFGLQSYSVFNLRLCCNWPAVHSMWDTTIRNYLQGTHFVCFYGAPGNFCPSCYHAPCRCGSLW